MKKCGFTLHCLYHESLTLTISLVNINRSGIVQVALIMAISQIIGKNFPCGHAPELVHIKKEEEEKESK